MYYDFDALRIISMAGPTSSLREINMGEVVRKYDMELFMAINVLHL